MTKRKRIGVGLGAPEFDLSDGDSYTEESPLVSGKKITWKLKYLDSDEIAEKCNKSLYNQRSFEDLSPSSVIDILPSIASAKGNSEPIKAIEDNGKFTILGGTRRTYAVSLVEDAQLKMLVVKRNDISQEEEAFYSVTMDQYRQPSQMDKAISLKNLIDSFGPDKSLRQIGEQLKMKYATLNYSKSYAEIPLEVREIFPALEYMKTPLLREIVKFKSQYGNDVLLEVIRTIEPVKGIELGKDLTDEDGAQNQLESLEKDCKLKSQELVKALKDYAKPDVKKSDYSGVFEDLVNKKGRGFKFSAVGNDKVRLEISEKELDSNTLDKLKELVELL